MQNIIYLLEKTELTYKEFSLINMNIVVGTNCLSLWKELMTIIEANCEEKKVDGQFGNLTFNMVLDDLLFTQISNLMQKEKAGENVNISYCSKEKGMIRALKFALEDVNIYLATKTKAILIEQKRTSKFWYIIPADYLKNIQFLKDGLKFFEHLLNKSLNRVNSILVHSAAVAYGENIVAIIGPKRSGKTTVFMDMIYNIGCAPVAFDKSHLIKNENHIVLYGIPSKFRVLAGTLKKYNGFFEQLIPESYKNASSDELWKGESSGKVEVTNDDFMAFSQKEFIKCGHLKLIIIPDIKKNNSPMVSRISYEEFLEIVNTQFYTPYNKEEDWWSDIGKSDVEIAIMENNKREIVKYIWENIPIIKLSASSNLKEIINSIKDCYL